MLRCLKVVAVHLADQPQDLPPDLPADRVADPHRDKEASHPVDMDQRSRWMVRIKLTDSFYFICFVLWLIFFCHIWIHFQNVSNVTQTIRALRVAFREEPSWVAPAIHRRPVDITAYPVGNLRPRWTVRVRDPELRQDWLAPPAGCPQGL